MRRINFGQSVTGRSNSYSSHYRNRRQGYYHGKYNREVITTLLLLAFVAVCLYKVTA